jgi:hypothetical protein
VGWVQHRTSECAVKSYPPPTPSQEGAKNGLHVYIEIGMTGRGFIH